MTDTPTVILFSGDPENGKASMDVFRSTDDTSSDLDPYHRAVALRDSTSSDFPNRLWAIGLNEPARKLMREARMKAMGLEPCDD